MNHTAGDSQTTMELNTTYEPYSNDPDYIEGNRGFIRALELNGVRNVLDLACGIGTCSDLLWECYPNIDIVGIDLSPACLGITKQKFHRQERFHGTGSGHLEPSARRGTCTGLIAAKAQDLPLDSATLDVVVMGHSIHLIEDEPKLLGEVFRVLRPGGIFTFNTSFYAGTFVPGTESIYHDWVKNALSYIQDKHQQYIAQGKPGIRRTRGSVARAFSKTWPTPQEWTERLEQTGFKTARVFERTVTLTQYSFETIGAYAGFAQVILSGYPVRIASQALQVAAGPTLKAAGVERVPRYWLEVTVTK